MSPPSQCVFERSRSAADLYTAGGSARDCYRDNNGSNAGRSASLVVKSKKSSSRNSVSPSKRSSSPSKRSSSKSSDKTTTKHAGSRSRDENVGGDISPLSSASKSTVGARTPIRRSSGTGSVGSGSLSNSISSLGGASKKSSGGLSTSSTSTCTTSSSSSSRSSRLGDSSEELNVKREQRRRERTEQRKRERERTEQPNQEQIAMQQELRLQQLRVLEREILLQQQLDRDKQMEIEQKRRVTFRVGPDGGVASTIHWFFNENFPDLWWQQEELMRTLRVCMKTVHELRGVRGRDYVKSITRLYHSYKVTVTESQTARSLQVIASMEHARGLEQHVAQKLRAQSGQQRKLVLELQQRLRHPNSSKLVDFSEHTALLRKESMKHSRPSRQFAFMIAQYDTHEALQASLSSWRDDDDQDYSLSSR